jgi:DNA polymerase-1
MTFAFRHALYRGAFIVALARTEAAGVPLDHVTLTAIRDAREALRQLALREANAEWGFWERAQRGGRLVFKRERVEAWIASRGWVWPKLTSRGRPCLDKDVLDEVGRILPEVARFAAARQLTNGLRLESLSVDGDGRSRVLLSPFGTITGRNAPSSSRYIFGQPRWLRHLIQAPPGRALAYTDWSAQEYGVMAALSQDAGLLADYQSGDPYLGLAIRFGMAPVGATKATHPEVRDRFKLVTLATSYGMGARSLRAKLQVPLGEAQRLLELHHELHPTFWRWSDRVVDLAYLRAQLSTPFGWRLWVPSSTAQSERTLRNWPVQSTAAEMMRVALVGLWQAGVQVDAVIHDAFLIEAAADRIRETIVTAERVMAEASRRVLHGVLTLRSDVQVIPPGIRFRPSTGGDTWAWVLEHLGHQEADAGASLGDARADAGASLGDARADAGASPWWRALTYLPSLTYPYKNKEVEVETWGEVVR